MTDLLTDKHLFERGCVLTVGSFDGVHVGHAALLDKLRAMADRTGLPAVVLTFAGGDRPKASSPLLAEHGEKTRLIESRGIDAVIELPFSRIKDTSPVEFIERAVFGELNAKGVVCGYDFRFGAGRGGDPSLFASLAAARGAAFELCDPVVVDGAPVSSTSIRALIAGGEIKKANRLLGREFSFGGVVEHGMHLATSLGIPTINLKYPSGLVTPRFGVYAVRCRLDGERFEGIADIGVKPTLGLDLPPLCEANLFGFDRDVYGRYAEIALCDFIRGEMRFESVKALAERMKSDALQVKALFEKERI